MRIRRIALALLLVTTILVCGWWVFTKYHSHRARKLALLMAEVSRTGKIESGDVEKFKPVKGCAEQACQYTLEESNYGEWLLGFYGRHHFPKWPAPFAMQGSFVLMKDGSLDSSTLTIEEGSDDGPGPVAIIQSFGKPSNKAWGCNLAENRHHSLNISMKKGYILIARAEPNLDVSVRNQLFSVNWGCLGSRHGCGKTENLLPQAAQIIAADNEWQRTHPDELEAMINSCVAERDSTKP